MTVITKGRAVDLAEPFPPDRLPDFHRWLQVSILSRTGEFPRSDDFCIAMEKALAADKSGFRTWGVHDKTDGALVGIVMYEPFGSMGGRSYVASARRAWGRGLMEEAALLCIGQTFDNPDIGYIFGLVTGNNAPARHFNRRIGMRLKDIVPHYTLQAGKLRDLLIFEMTRETWTQLH